MRRVPLELPKSLKFSLTITCETYLKKVHCSGARVCSKVLPRLTNSSELFPREERGDNGLNHTGEELMPPFHIRHVH